MIALPYVFASNSQYVDKQQLVTQNNDGTNVSADFEQAHPYIYYSRRPGMQNEGTNIPIPHSDITLPSD